MSEHLRRAEVTLVAVAVVLMVLGFIGMVYISWGCAHGR